MDLNIHTTRLLRSFEELDTSLELRVSSDCDRTDRLPSKS